MSTRRKFMEDSNLDLNGELYLKKNPDKYYSHKKDRYFINSRLNRSNGIRLEKKIDYSKMICFWQLVIDDRPTLNLRVCDPSYNIEESYNSIGDLEKDFVKLTEFLKHATFVGRQFKRTAPVYSGSGRHRNISFMSNSDEQHIALYCTKDLFLVKSTYFGLPPKYRLLEGTYTLDGNYEFFGPVYEEYRDKDKVYTEILQQVTQYDKGRGR